MSDEEAQKSWEERHAVDPNSRYGKELAEAQEYWRAEDGVKATLIEGEEGYVDILKTQDGRNDGEKGYSSTVRERLYGDFTVLLLDSVRVGGEWMHRVTNGSVVGWVPASKLKRWPERPAYPDPLAVPIGAGVDSLHQLTASPFCEAFKCTLLRSLEAEGGSVLNQIAITGAWGWELQVESDGARVSGATVTISARARDAEGRVRLRLEDRRFADAVVRTILGRACPAAERLAEESMNRPPAAGEEPPSAECGEWTLQAAQDTAHHATLRMRRQGE
ncbi:MAG TPA: hypothetical protein VF746_22055 [Longimicrobium sp.]